MPYIAPQGKWAKERWGVLSWWAQSLICITCIVQLLLLYVYHGMQYYVISKYAVLIKTQMYKYDFTQGLFILQNWCHGSSSDLVIQREIWNFGQFLTLGVWGPSYLSLIMPISWLLMPWLLASPGRQQPWYWLVLVLDGGRISSHLCHVIVEEW